MQFVDMAVQGEKLSMSNRALTLKGLPFFVVMSQIIMDSYIKHVPSLT